MARRNSKNNTPAVENIDSTATEASAEVENTEYTPEEENVVSEQPEHTEEAAVQPENTDEATTEATTEAYDGWAVGETNPNPDAEESSADAIEPEAEEDAKADKPAKAEADLTDFQAAVDAALEGKDSTTGEVAPAFINPVQEAFRQIDGAKGKNRAKAVLNEGMKDAMNSMDIVVARAYMTLSDSLTAVKSTGHKAEKVPTDPTEAFVERIVGLKLGFTLAQNHVPEGVSGTWQDKSNELFTQSQEAANAYLAWVQREPVEEGAEDVPEPEASSVVKAAVKLSLGKSVKVSGGKVSKAGTGTPFEGTRRDISKHIVSAFDDLEAGSFLTVSQIRAKKSDEYGDDLPSAGAISIRLFPKNDGKMTVPGVKAALSSDGKNNKGAIKL